jgi:acetyltransferase-like isoleucine patch superfamily enzyme
MHKKYNKLEIYGFIGFIRLCCCYLHTKLFFPNSRMVRFPIEIRGRKFIDFGKRLTTGKGCRIEAYPYCTKKMMIQFGNDIEINDYVHIAAADSVTIGNNVLIASKVFISDLNHGHYSGQQPQDHPDFPPNQRALNTIPVVIEDNVWIGESVTILSGVTIGKGSIIGANSVVTKSIPSRVIAVGIPAKPIKFYNELTGYWEKSQ